MRYIYWEWINILIWLIKLYWIWWINIITKCDENVWLINSQKIWLDDLIKYIIHFNMYSLMYSIMYVIIHLFITKYSKGSLRMIYSYLKNISINIYFGFSISNVPIRPSIYIQTWGGMARNRKLSTHKGLCRFYTSSFLPCYFLILNSIK